MVSSLFRGLLLGLVIAATPGPIFFLCLNRTLRLGWRQGLASGLGIATADAGYALVASLGLAVLVAALQTQRSWLSLAAGIFLLVLAARALTQKAAASPIGADAARPLGLAFASMFALTAGNPLTILSFAALLTGMGMQSGRLAAAAAVAAGAFLGSATWWLVLVLVVARLRTFLSPPVARGLNLVSGVVLAAFGLNAVLNGMLGILVVARR